MTKNILFISRYKYPHIGGVEKHIEFVKNDLEKRGYKINIVSESDIKYPTIKFIGLIYIWYWFFKNIYLIKRSDVIHIHDVFIWYLPFRFIFPSKKVFITFHGWEGVYPIPFYNKLNKLIANTLSFGSIAVGKYIEKWYGIKSKYIIYGATNIVKNNNIKKIKNTVVWLGRQDKDTGIDEFKKWLLSSPKLRVKYITNISNPYKYLKTSEYCVPSGYLSYLEAKAYGCKVITFADNPLKKDYWNGIKSAKHLLSWKDVANIYIKLWQK